MYSESFIYIFSSRLVNSLFRLASIFCFLLVSNAAVAADEINAKDQLALHGYDPVSYFSGEPVAGNEDIFSVKNQVKYLFSSTANKQKFDHDTERYLPMYGGYCAYGVRMGKKLNNDPFAYEIRDDRLYVLLNRATHKAWRQDMKKNIRISDHLWPQIKTRSIKSLQ